MPVARLISRRSPAFRLFPVPPSNISGNFHAPTPVNYVLKVGLPGGPGPGGLETRNAPRGEFRTMPASPWTTNTLLSRFTRR